MYLAVGCADGYVYFLPFFFFVHYSFASDLPFNVSAFFVLEFLFSSVLMDFRSVFVT